MKSHPNPASLSARGHSPGRAGPDRPGGWPLARVVPRRAMAARLASIPYLPGDTLVEFVFRRRLSLWVVLAQGDALHLPERRRTGGHQVWRRCGLADRGQDVAHQGRDILLSVRLLKKSEFIIDITRARDWRSN